jgi:VanZ family protein
LNFLWLWAPAILQMGLIFGASSLTEPGLPGGVSDKSGHFTGYLILSALLVRALAGGRIAGITWRAILLAVLGATLYGVTDEIHQRFVPGRSPDLADIVADAAGAVGGGVLCGILRVATRSRKVEPSRPT